MRLDQIYRQYSNTDILIQLDLVFDESQARYRNRQTMYLMLIAEAVRRGLNLPNKHAAYAYRILCRAAADEKVALKLCAPGKGNRPKADTERSHYWIARSMAVLLGRGYTQRYQKRLKREGAESIVARATGLPEPQVHDIWIKYGKDFRRQGVKRFKDYTLDPRVKAVLG